MSTSTQTHTYFIAGTDTEIGKTLISSALIFKLASQGCRVAGIKPVASGTYDNNGWQCNEDVEALKAQSSVRLPDALVNQYLMREPTAPHIAAATEGIDIDVGHIQRSVRMAQAASDHVIVEGVGGLLVPLNAQMDTGDLAVLLDLPVILVVGIRLGCMSHALLTAQAIAARGLPLAGWVANTVSPDMLHIGATIASLASRMPAPMLGCVPYLASPSAREAAAYIDLPAES